MTAKAEDVANYFLNYVCKSESCGGFFTNLHIQKLVYYVQGFSLAILDRPMFTEKINYWGVMGVVVPDLYIIYRARSVGPIKPPDDFCAKDVFKEEEIEILDLVFEAYGQFSAWKLKQLILESPWSKINFAKRGSSEITHDELKDYFLTLVN